MTTYSSEEMDPIVQRTFFAYIKKIFWRTARDYINSENKFRRHVVYIEDISPTELGEFLRISESDSERSKSNFQIYLENDHLADMISEVSEKDHELLFLLFYTRMSTKEVARSLGISQQAVSKRKKKLLRRLLYD